MNYAKESKNIAIASLAKDFFVNKVTESKNNTNSRGI
jgi:hypothetical protein